MISKNRPTRDFGPSLGSASRDCPLAAVAVKAERLQGIPRAALRFALGYNVDAPFGALDACCRDRSIAEKALRTLTDLIPKEQPLC